MKRPDRKPTQCKVGELESAEQALLQTDHSTTIHELKQYTGLGTDATAAHETIRQHQHITTAWSQLALQWLPPQNQPGLLPPGPRQSDLSHPIPGRANVRTPQVSEPTKVAKVPVRCNFAFITRRRVLEQPAQSS